MADVNAALFYANAVNFIQVNMNEIRSYALSGNIESIEFVDCRIGAILAFAINCPADTLYRISIDNCRIDRIESQAFKSLQLQRFTIRNTVFTSPLVNRAFYRLAIDDNLLVQNCTFDAIATGAFQSCGMFNAPFTHLRFVG